MQVRTGPHAQYPRSAPHMLSTSYSTRVHVYRRRVDLGFSWYLYFTTVLISFLKPFC
jgi:hypothetical protein